MTSVDYQCPKCKGKMEEGFIIDNAPGQTVVSNWVEGQPERSFWAGIKIRDKKILKVRTFRCEECGYLESYAR